MGLDLTAFATDFPILSRKVNGKDLVYFDNAATSQTPTQVIDVIADYYQQYNEYPSWCPYPQSRGNRQI